MAAVLAPGGHRLARRLSTAGFAGEPKCARNAAVRQLRLTAPGNW
jgi:hypothetical protein